MAETFGARIRARRLELKLGLRETAKRAGVSATFLSRVETGAEKAVPSEDVIRKLADILQEDFDSLMALAGRVASEVAAVVREDPAMPAFLRRARDRNIPATKLMELLDKVEDNE